MNNGIFIGGLTATFLFVGILALSLNVTPGPFPVDFTTIVEPTGGFLDGILRALTWAFAAVNVFTIVLTFNTAALGIPLIPGLLLTTFVMGVLAYLIIRLIRGGG